MLLIKDVATIIGCLISVITLLTLMTKGGRAFIKNFFKKNTEELRKQNEVQNSDIASIEERLNLILTKFDAIEEVSKQQCRDTIKNIYYKYHNEKKLPLYERRTADKTYDIYFNKFQGNSYASLLYNEICKWEIDTVSYDDLEEEDETTTSVLYKK